MQEFREGLMEGARGALLGLCIWFPVCISRFAFFFLGNDLVAVWSLDAFDGHPAHVQAEDEAHLAEADVALARGGVEHRVVDRRSRRVVAPQLQITRLLGPALLRADRLELHCRALHLLDVLQLFGCWAEPRAAVWIEKKEKPSQRERSI